jgi:hypothetical protein
MFNKNLITDNTHVNKFNGGINMRKLSEAEVLSLTGVLTMEKDGLAVAKAMKALITDEEIKKQADTGILAAESRIKGIQQFISENHIIETKGVQ